MENERRKTEILVEIDRYKLWVKYSVYSTALLILGGIYLSAQSAILSMTYSWYGPYNIIWGINMLVMGIFIACLREFVWFKKINDLEAEYASL